MARLIPDDLFGALTIWAEARGEPFEGKVAVGEVIRERMRRRFASDGTVVGTVLRSFQFSCYNPGDPNRILLFSLDDTHPLYHECAEAWSQAAAPTFAEGAVFYCHLEGLTTKPTWATTEKFVAKHGRHSFFRD